jgi:hypothetical protein
MKKIIIRHLLAFPDEKESVFATPESFLSFVEEIKRENEDNSMRTDTVPLAKSYIKTYCGNLELIG